MRSPSAFNLLNKRIDCYFMNRRKPKKRWLFLLEVNNIQGFGSVTIYLLNYLDPDSTLNVIKLKCQSGKL